MTALLCLSLALATDPDTTSLQDPVPSTSAVAQVEENAVAVSVEQSVSAVEQATQLNASLTEILARVEELQAPVAVTESVPVERVDASSETK